MENIQFKTNKIVCEETKDGGAVIKDVLMLKDTSRYGSQIAVAIANELLPNKLEYKDSSVLDKLLETYEDEYEENDLDPIADIIGSPVEENERDGIRVWYMLMKDTELPDDLSLDKLIKAYHESIDISTVDDSELESAFI